MEVIHIDHQKILPRPTASSVALGNFDGLHIGHQQVIDVACKHARGDGICAAVMTFDPHPREVLQPKTRQSTYLTPLPEKIALLETFGIDLVYVVQFTGLFSRLQPQQFINDYLVGLGIRHVVSGVDFRFGKDGTGTVEMLRQWARQTNTFRIHTVSHCVKDGEKVSSSRIRACLDAGNVSLVSTLLNRHYHISGMVVSGQQRGRTIGFPTANVSLTAPYKLPKNGVYAVYVCYSGTIHGGVANIGVKPTFQTVDEQTIEVYIFDFNQDIYDHQLDVYFVQHIRSEQRFPSVETLIKQIEMDVENTRHILSEHAFIADSMPDYRTKS